MSFEDWMFMISFSPVILLAIFVEVFLRYFFPEEKSIKKVEDTVFPKENNS